VQRCVAQLPWRSHVALLQQLHNAGFRLWYAKYVLESGLRQDVLVTQIESRLPELEGRAQHNFEDTLSQEHSDLAQGGKPNAAAAMKEVERPGEAGT